MRIPATREQHSRDGPRDSTDLTDAEWDVIAPLLPAACPLGRPRLWSMRDIVNGILCVLRGGVPWRLLPKDQPPKSTVYGCFSAWRDSGLFASINRHLVMRDRERVGRGWCVLRHGPEGPCSATVLVVELFVRPSRVSAPFCRIKASAGALPLTRLCALTRGAGAGPDSTTLIAVEIVRKPPGQVGFVVHPRRWVVERSFAWISRNRRLWKDPEATVASAKAFLYAASVMMLLRRIGCEA